MSAVVTVSLKWASPVMSDVTEEGSPTADAPFLEVSITTKYIKSYALFTKILE